MIEISMDGNRQIVGIDLGTTTSCISTIIKGRPKVLSNKHGQRVFPSIVGFSPSGELVGQEARKRLITDPENTIYSFKRLLGRDIRDPLVRTAIAGSPYKIVQGPSHSVIVECRGKQYSIPEIASRLLRSLLKIAEDSLGYSVKSGVIAVPANFNNRQRDAVTVAAKIAGLREISLINEPTSAALAFGIQKNLPGILCVYDFGGGTFDVTILKTGPKAVRVLSVDGDSMLGGDDLDFALAFAAAEAFRVETGRNLWRDTAEWQKLVFACEQAKRRLSVEAKTEIRLRSVARTPSGVKDLVYSLDRKRFQRICGEKIDQTLRCCHRALFEASHEATSVDRVILVGGSSFIRLVRSKVASFFNCKPNISADPVEAVCLGASIHGAHLRGIDIEEPPAQKLLEVSSQMLAISSGQAPSVVFERNEPLPAFEKRIISTTQDNQTEINLRLFQGNDTRSWRSLGGVVVRGLKPGPKGKVHVEANLQIDIENRVRLEVVDPETGRRLISNFT